MQGRGVTTNLTAAGQSGAPASAPDLNTDTSPGYFDPTNPVLNQNISQTDDYVYSAFLFPVNKTQALAYIDNSGPKPERFAKVIAIRGSVPDVMEYKVQCHSFSPVHLECCNADLTRILRLVSIASMPTSTFDVNSILWGARLERLAYCSLLW